MNSDGTVLVSYQSTINLVNQPLTQILVDVFRSRKASNNAHLQATIGPLLKSRSQERVGEGGSALDLAIRVLTYDSLVIECSVDRHTLLRLQRQDGGWQSGWMYRYGSTGVKTGNCGVTTALAVKAIASSTSDSKAAAAESSHA